MVYIILTAFGTVECFSSWLRRKIYNFFTKIVPYMSNNIFNGNQTPDRTTFFYDRDMSYTKDMHLI